MTKSSYEAPPAPKSKAEVKRAEALGRKLAKEFKEKQVYGLDNQFVKIGGKLPTNKVGNTTNHPSQKRYAD